MPLNLQSKLKVSEIHTTFVETLSVIQQVACGVAFQDTVPDVGEYVNRIAAIFVEKLLPNIDIAKQELHPEEFHTTLSWVIEKFEWMLKHVRRGNTSAMGYMVRAMEIFVSLLTKTEKGMTPSDLQKNLLEFSSDIKNIWESSDFKKRDSVLTNWEERFHGN